MKSFLSLLVLVFSATVGAETVNVQMTTSLGIIEMEIYTDAAPITAGNFLRLVDGGHLDGWPGNHAGRG